MPAATPVTRPEPEPIVAIDTSLLLHVPPLVASVSVVVAPSQTLSVPPIVAGSGLMVTNVVLRHDVGSV